MYRLPILQVWLAGKIYYYLLIFSYIRVNNLACAKPVTDWNLNIRDVPERTKMGQSLAKGKLHRGENECYFRICPQRNSSEIIRWCFEREHLPVGCDGYCLLSSLICVAPTTNTSACTQSAELVHSEQNLTHWVPISFFLFFFLLFFSLYPAFFTFFMCLRLCFFSFLFCPPLLFTTGINDFPRQEHFTELFLYFGLGIQGVLLITFYDSIWTGG